jgi:NTP pyrophosphatase (non-canonical NTP hydrolase)
MNFDSYQKQSQKTDKHGNDRAMQLKISLLGLAGETGTLLAEYKKLLRDGKARELFVPYYKEELGDLLWYMSSVASALGLKLGDIAKNNLRKTRGRWTEKTSGQSNVKHFDAKFKRRERLPRVLNIEFLEFKEKKSTRVCIFANGVVVGDVLTDNSHEDIGYRYHDVFHLAYATILGWSPVLRKLLHKKRKSNPKTDEVEDGARATLTEETIAIFIYANASYLNHYDGVQAVDFSILKMVAQMTRGFEVEKRSLKQWETAITMGYEMFRQLLKNRGGIVLADRNKETMTYKKLSEARKNKLRKEYQTLEKHGKLS